MRFNHWHLGQREGGDVIVINLPGDAAEVRLLDSDNFQSYQAGQGYRYYGGKVDLSPSEIPIPYNGTWHIAADLPAPAGQPHGGIKVVPRAARQPLPRFQQPSLAPIAQATAEISAPSLPPALPARTKRYDVLIVHASADRDEVVNSLAMALRERGLSVRCTEFSSGAGDSLPRKIAAGIAQSRFGIIVLSAHFFASQWTRRELDRIVTIHSAGKQAILPIWHKLTKDEVIAHSPPLADSIARSTTDSTISEIASEIAEVIYDHKQHAAAGGLVVNGTRNG